MKVRFGGNISDVTADYDIYKTFQDLFLPGEKHNNMTLEGIQSEDLCKIRSGAGDAKTSGGDTKKKMNKVYGKRYRINLDHQILTDNSIFYPQALYSDLAFEVTLAPASQVVKGSDPTKLKYKLTNIQLEYKRIHSQMLAEEAKRVYTTGKEFAYDHVILDKVMPINKGTDTRINIKVNAQRSMKGILLLFVEPYTAGKRDSEKYIFPDLNKVKVMINGLPNRLYNEGIESEDIWSEVSSFFIKEKKQTPAYDSGKVLHQK